LEEMKDAIIKVQQEGLAEKRRMVEIEKERRS
jgi:hypothetical protein